MVARAAEKGLVLARTHPDTGYVMLSRHGGISRNDRGGGVATRYPLYRSDRISGRSVVQYWHKGVPVKRCPTCDQERPSDQFYRDASRRDGFAVRCKSCHQTWKRQWRVSESGRRSSRLAQRRHRERRFAEIKNALPGLACQRCGETDPVVLEFHHRDRSEKSGEVSRMIASHRPWQDVSDEIAKCDVLCANCHRRLHHHEYQERVERTTREPQTRSRARSGHSSHSDR